MSNPTTPFSWQMPTSTDLVTDLPADFEVFGQAVATSMADLLGGASGYILSKNSATDMDFVWIANDQGDITGITAGNGISVTNPTGPVPTVAIDTAVTVDKTTAQTLTNKTLTTPIISSISNTGTLTLPTSTDTLVGRATTDTLTNKTLTSPALTTPTISTLTTNGDLVYGTGSGALSRLGIGSTSQVLTVTGGVPVWATPAGGGGKVLQVVQGTRTTTFTTTSTSAVDSGLSVAITPSLATSRIMVFVSGMAQVAFSGSSGSNQGNFTLVRTSTTLQSFVTGYYQLASSTNGEMQGAINFSYLDSPSTTSATTYKMQMLSDTSSTTTSLLASATRIASIVAMEIGA